MKIKKKGSRKSPEGDDGDEVNEFVGNIASVEGGEADRVLTSVRNKLSRELSVETVVHNLILVSSNPENLAQMFPGKFVQIILSMSFTINMKSFFF